jgi:peptide-methionine (S)-S-oxide reductase
MSDILQTLKPLALGAGIALGLVLTCDREAVAQQTPGTATAILAGGCFWCVEADFEKVDGVIEAVSGYTGGDVANPTYKQVTRGGTGHYEAVEIVYDPDTIDFERIVELFLRSVDPTDPGGQFCDRGESYRTAIFVDGPEERAIAEREIAAAERALGREVVTPVLAEQTFWPAEPYHQDYYRSEDRILTRFGFRTKATAYDLYREACGRDARVRDLWGDAAPFAAG